MLGITSATNKFKPEIKPEHVKEQSHPHTWSSHSEDPELFYNSPA